MNIKIIYLALSIFFLSGGLCAQSFLGLHVGINSGKFSGDAPKDFIYKGKLLFNAGTVFDLKIKEDAFLSIAPSYMISGSKLQYPHEINEDESEYRDSVDLKMQLFTIPIIMKIISDNERFQFSGGFELSFPIKLIGDNSVEEIDLTNDINNIAINMIFGIGYRIPIETSFLVINLAYSQGLTNLANNEVAYDSLLPRIRFTSFRLTTAWLLPLGKSKD